MDSLLILQIISLLFSITFLIKKVIENNKLDLLIEKNLNSEQNMETLAQTNSVLTINIENSFQNSNKNDINNVFDDIQKNIEYLSRHLNTQHLSKENRIKINELVLLLNKLNGKQENYQSKAHSSNLKRRPKFYFRSSESVYLCITNKHIYAPVENVEWINPIISSVHENLETILNKSSIRDIEKFGINGNCVIIDNISTDINIT